LCRERPEKKWDLVGGHLEKGETPWEALVRETKEEVDLDIYRSDFHYLGESIAYGQYEVVVSHIFIGFTRQLELYPKPPSQVDFCGFSDLHAIPVSNAVDWFPRHRDYLLSVYPSFFSVLQALTLHCNMPHSFGLMDTRGIVATAILNALDTNAGVLYYTHCLRLLGKISATSIGSDILKAMITRGLVSHDLDTDRLSCGDLSSCFKHESVEVPAMVVDDISPVDQQDVPQSPVVSDLDSNVASEQAPPPGSSSSGRGFRQIGRTFTFDERKLIAYVGRNPRCTSQQIKRACGPQALTIAYKMPELTVESVGADKHWWVNSEFADQCSV